MKRKPTLLVKPTPEQEAYLNALVPKPVWVCCGCGKATGPNRIRKCECATGLCYDVNDPDRITGMRRLPFGYDQSCYDLAKLFLSSDQPFAHLNTEENREDLAELIQRVIEDHIEYDLKLRRPSLAVR